MIQLYFLSVLCNGLAGYILFSNKENDSENFGLPFNNPTFYLVLGILCIVTGVLKILSPINGFMILGDFFPAAGGIAAGIVLIFGIYRQNGYSGGGELDRIGTNLLALRRPVGMGLIGIALVHFILGELFLL